MSSEERSTAAAPEAQQPAAGAAPAWPATDSPAAAQQPTAAAAPSAPHQLPADAAAGGLEHGRNEEWDARSAEPSGTVAQQQADAAEGGAAANSARPSKLPRLESVASAQSAEGGRGQRHPPAHQLLPPAQQLREAPDVQMAPAATDPGLGHPAPPMVAGVAAEHAQHVAAPAAAQPAPAWFVAPTDPRKRPGDAGSNQQQAQQALVSPQQQPGGQQLPDPQPQVRQPWQGPSATPAALSGPQPQQAAWHQAQAAAGGGGQHGPHGVVPTTTAGPAAAGISQPAHRSREAEARAQRAACSVGNLARMVVGREALIDFLQFEESLRGGWSSLTACRDQAECLGVHAVRNGH